MRLGLAVIIGAALAAGCISGGRSGRIRQITPDDAAECRFLGIVEAADRSGWTMADDQLGAMPVIRRMVSEKGGNAFVVTHQQGVKYAPATRAEVYRCK